MTFFLSSSNHHAGNQVGHRVFSILNPVEHELIFDKFSRELFHLWHILFLEEFADFLISVDFFFVKDPRGERTSSEQIMTGMILASTRIRENALTNWDRSFYFSGHNSSSDCVKIEIHDVEVESSVDCAHEGDIAVPMMRKLMAMATQDAVDGPFRQRIDKVNHFIIFA